MNQFTQKLVGKKASDLAPDYKINCFTTVISYFEKQIRDGKTSAQEMLDWLKLNTTQTTDSAPATIAVIWSTSDEQLSPDKITVKELDPGRKGYPFGLVMEHAFVFIGQDTVFQKASPSDEHPFEILSFEEVLKAYKHLGWSRITFHNVARA